MKYIILIVTMLVVCASAGAGKKPMEYLWMAKVESNSCWSGVFSGVQLREMHSDTMLILGTRQKEACVVWKNIKAGDLKVTIWNQKQAVGQFMPVQKVIADSTNADRGMIYLRSWK